MNRKLLTLCVLGFTSLRCGQHITAVSTTTTNGATTTTMSSATQAFIYQQLIGNGISAQEALTQSQAWHPPMVIPFTNSQISTTPTNPAGQGENTDDE